MSNTQSSISWVEISRSALIKNIQSIRKIIGDKVILSPVVKANAYGHGLTKVAPIFMQAGADWLCVNSLVEAKILRNAGIKCPIYILGYVLKDSLYEAAKLDCRIVVYNKETIAHIADFADKLNKKVRVHIKIETGNNRQGILPCELANFIKYIKKIPKIEIEGISTHFANLEDTTNFDYADFQLKNFANATKIATQSGILNPIRHCAASAGTILFPKVHMEMVRPGIISYGLWPSDETKKSALKAGIEIDLKPSLTWKTRIAQIKEIPKGSYVGYGCTYKTKKKTRLAILPVGYYDGYDRGLSNKGTVLIHGKRAPVRGRICMNITMVDITSIPSARIEDEVVLIGRSGSEQITAEDLAKLCETINYEITTRISESIPRFITN